MKLHTTTGTVAEVKKLWWIKVKLKAVRVSPTDGAAFPHGVRVKYAVNGKDYTAKAYLPWRLIPPEVGSEVAVLYADGRPRLSFIDFFGGGKK
ncbi:MAG: sugar ABC transporter permease [Lachnospiraceae bacterium]|nr:sugar ABC transporter permease [Ruminococcus sp.]MCM1276729.1 sugar ABC transporter permease [Lachnospiraceae bacterium]